MDNKVTEGKIEIKTDPNDLMEIVKRLFKEKKKAGVMGRGVEAEQFANDPENFR